jgi:uncharacterized protein (DUF58 family)
VASTAPTRRFLDPRVLAKLGNLTLFARRPMLGSVAGKHQSPHRGSSVEFAEYRKYVPGDDTRRLDWRAYARSDRFYIKEFEADTNLRLVLVVDVSGSMRFASGGVTKIDHARRIAATLAYLALQQGDAVGLSLASTALSLELRPSRRSTQLSIVNDFLERCTPAGETGLCPVIHSVADKNRQRALVVMLSDFFVDPPELENCFQHLRFRNHDAVAFQLLAKEERKFDYTGPIRFVDLEGGADFTTNPQDIAKTYRAALEKHTDELKRAALGAGVEFHQVGLDEPYGDFLARFLLARSVKKGRR